MEKCSKEWQKYINSSIVPESKILNSPPHLFPPLRARELGAIMIIRARAKYRQFQSTVNFHLRRILTCPLKLWDNTVGILPI